MQSLLNLQDIKNLYKKGVEHSKKAFNSTFFPNDDIMFDYQQKLIDKATDLSTVMNTIAMTNFTFANAFANPKQICKGCELQHTGVQFGVGNSGWYFVSGVTEQYSYNFSLFRQEIAPPNVISVDRSECVRWTINGGYGNIGTGVWHSIQNEWIYMKYTQPSYSTFTLQGSGNNINVEFSSLQPMQFLGNITFTDDKKQQHVTKFEMVANTPPVPNFPNSCDCMYGLGTLYYSYTDMTTKFTLNNGTPVIGPGWIDHQLVKYGFLNNKYMEALQTVNNMISKPVSSGWLWFAVQDYESKKQYMFIHFFKTKTFKDDIKLNNSISADVCNVYEKGLTYFLTSNDVTIQMIESIPYVLDGLSTINLPSKYNITLPCGKNVILKIATLPNVYGSVNPAYETPALLYDSKNNVIGSGLIEANLYLSNQELAMRAIKAAGGDPTNSDQIKIVMEAMNKPQSSWIKFLAVMIVLLPMWILIVCLIFIFYKKDKRLTRTLLSVTMILILIMLA